MLRFFVFFGLLIAVSAAGSAADQFDRKKLVDKRGPAGIVGDHMHKQGKWMAEYRYMNMYMDDNRIGQRTISDADALGPITVDGITTNAGATPTQMTMEMHMIHLMYGATDDVTLYSDGDAAKFDHGPHSRTGESVTVGDRIRVHHSQQWIR